MRMLLEAMEQALRSNFAETQDVPKNLTIEHIMPQGWREHWPPPAGATANMRDRAIQTIGNLTLINDRLNPHQSNRPWIDAANPTGGKRKALNDHTVLFLHKAVCQSEEWDENRIEQRSKDLFALALKVWPRVVHQFECGEGLDG